MVRLRYDYLLHATVPADEDWGLPDFHAGLGPSPDLDLDEAALADRLDAYVRDRPAGDAALLAYKSANHALAVKEADRMADRCRSRPFVVQVSRTERCNLSCVYCRPTRDHHSTRVLDFAPWHGALPVLLEPALEFMPFCWGEPLMAPDFDLTCDFARRYRTAVSFITNLLYLDDALASQFVRGVTRALVSIDTADPREFYRLRSGGSLARVEANLRLLRSAAEAEGVPMPWLGISAVLLPETLDGLPDLIRWGADHGFRGISVRRVVLRDNIIPLHEVARTDLVSPSYRGVLDDCRRVCESTGVALNMADPDSCPGRDAMCPCPWHHVYMSASGTLSKCSFSHHTVLGDAPVDDSYWNAAPFLATRRAWTPTFRCPECSSLDFIGRPEVSQVRGY